MKIRNRRVPKGIILLGLVILLLVSVWIIPFKTENVTVQFWTDETVEGRQVPITIYTEEAFEQRYTTEMIVSEQMAYFNLNYEYLLVDEVATEDIKFVQSVEGMRVLSNGYQPSNYVSAICEGEVFEERADGRYVFTDDAMTTIEEGIENPLFERKAMSVIIIALYVSVVLYQLVKSHFGKPKSIGIISIIWSVILLINALYADSTLEYEINIANTMVKNTSLIIGIIVIFATLLMICILWDKENEWTQYIVIGIYAVVLAFGIGKILFYGEKVANTPDELAHISYIAYLDETDEIVPKFENMQLMVTENKEENEMLLLQFEEGTVNYLMHPPLYYQIMRVAGGITKSVDGLFTVNLDRLRTFSALMVVAALIILFYIGYSRFKKIPLLHLLYAMICISVPMLTYCASGISNDSMAILTVSIFLLGILRYIEKKRTFLTYLLIGVGVCATMLTKLTAGIMVVIAALVVLILTLVKEENWKELLSWRFTITWILYFLTAAYYIYLYMQYGSFQIGLFSISEEYARNTGFYVQADNRIVMSLWTYISYFWERFMGSWTGISSHIALTKSGTFGALSEVALQIIWFLPLVVLIIKPIRKKVSQIQCITGFYAGILVTFLLQLYNGYMGFCTRGYLGATQSRYYLCAIGCFAFSATAIVQYALENVKGKEKCIDVFRTIIVFAVVIFIGLLAYEDFIYFLLYYRNYLG